MLFSKCMPQLSHSRESNVFQNRALPLFPWRICLPLMYII
nr:MAG TPA: hypothetical protein [Caudoviricetes sp.]